MYEIEQKYRCSNLSRIRTKLRALKAKLIKKGSELNEFWDFENRLARKKTVLRLRKHGNTAELTLKGPKLKSRYSKRVEIQTPVEYAPTRVLLIALGFKLNKSYSKKREVYKLGRIMVTLDALRGFGTFVELEGSEKEIARAAARLGIPDRDREQRSYLEMLYRWRD